MYTKLVIGHHRTPLLDYAMLPARYKKQVNKPGLFFIYKGILYALDDFKEEKGTLTCSKTLRRFNYDYICLPLALQALDACSVRVCRIEPRADYCKEVKADYCKEVKADYCTPPWTKDYYKENTNEQI